MHEQITIKFLLKCLYQGDDVAGKILQIEATPHHPYNYHTRITKEFLVYSNGLNGRLSRTNFEVFDKEQLLYSKEKVLEHTCNKWDAKIKDNFDNIRKDDPYNLEQLYSDEYLHNYVNSLNSLRDPLFKRHEREWTTQILQISFMDTPSDSKTSPTLC